MRSRGHEVIMVDGGSQDNTNALARPYVDRILPSAPGRAMQMNTGAAAASADVLWFLHGDTLVPANADEIIGRKLKQSENKVDWGRFDIQLSGKHRLLTVVARCMNLRSRIFGIATGDQGVFISRELFEQIGGYSELPLMEDIDICRRLKKYQRPVCLRQIIISSSRRWEEKGILSTILLMWYLRGAYYFGVSAERLAVRYG